MSDLLGLTLCEAADAARSGQVGAVELLEAALAAVERHDGRINAVIATEPERALAEARALDALPADRRGILHGVPLAHKDMFHCAGEVSTYGAMARKTQRMQATSPLLAQLDGAGAVSFARLNMAPYAMGPTGHNPDFGRCRNPFAPDRITGGSSSGSGAAVAARFAYGALGSDTGGSVRLPAACCGVVGLKPTQGLLSLEQAMGLSESLDCPGPIARSSRDLARMMDVLDRPGYEATVDRDIRGLRLGVPTSYYCDGLHPEVQDNFDRAAGIFRDLGVTLVAIPVPDHGAYADLADAIWKPEAAALHLPALQSGPAALPDQARARLMQGLATSAVDYVRARRLRSIALHEMLSGPLAACDALLVPAMRWPVPLAARVEAALGDTMRRNLEALTAFTRPLNFLGLPGLVTPSGQDSGGVPLAVQLIAAPRQEQLLLRLGHRFEMEAGFNRLRPDFPG